MIRRADGTVSSSRVVLGLATVIGVWLVMTVTVLAFLEKEQTIPEDAWSYLKWITIAAFGEKAVAKYVKNGKGDGA